MTIRANCKINIGLDILHKREDGYHEISTLMYPIRGLYDEVTVVKNHNGDNDVTFISEGLVIDCPPEKNLCVKAARLMQSRYSQLIGDQGITITLNKVVPFGAGLGGGSSDATAVILAMNEIFTLSLPESELIALAAELGSDTPFFVRNTTQLCSGRGEIMQDFPLDLTGLYIALIKPEVHISTAEAYGGVKPATPITPLTELLSQPISAWQGQIKNDFEEHIFRSHPILAEVKTALLNAGALYAAMSGSGSTIFGIFRNTPQNLDNYSPIILPL
ncbi:MAG: 4-(cytidine 5'-diphospho)-2-C-methyl-D-erythritol kinase [Rikenellaceae bacterium]